MTEIQGKSSLVRVCARFELSGIDCKKEKNRERQQRGGMKLPEEATPRFLTMSVLSANNDKS